MFPKGIGHEWAYGSDVEGRGHGQPCLEIINKYKLCGP
jgi:hypothetical protein